MNIWKNVRVRLKLARRYLKRKIRGNWMVVVVREEPTLRLEMLELPVPAEAELVVKVPKQKIRKKKWKKRCAIVVWALLCLALATVAVRSTSSLLSDIDWKTVGLVALIVAAVVLIVWLLWSPTRRDYASGAMRSRLFLWPVVILLLVVVGIGAYGYLGVDRPTLVVGREWSPVIRVLPGQQVLWQRRENVAYEIMTQTGKIYRFARDPENDTRTPCERHVWIPEATSSFRIRVADHEVEKVGFDITFSQYTPGGPCEAVTPPLPPPSRVIPLPPSGDRYI